MKLSEASRLFEEPRYFTDVYKQLDFKDDSELREYLDLINHEPYEWMKNFPSKWKSESQFNKVRSGFRKLLKDSRVCEYISADYAISTSAVIWQAFKEHAAKIIAERRGLVVPQTNIIDQLADDGVEKKKRNPRLSLSAIDGESIHSMDIHRGPMPAKKNEVIVFPVLTTVQKAMDSAESIWEKKYRVLEAAYEALVAPIPQQAIDGLQIAPWNESCRPEDRLRNSAYILMKALGKF